MTDIAETEWIFSVDSADYTILLGRFGDHDAYVGLCSITEEEVTVVLPAAVLPEVETASTEVITVPAGQIKNRTAASPVRLQVFLAQLPADSLAGLPVATFTESAADTFFFGRNPRSLPFWLALPVVDPSAPLDEEVEEVEGEPVGVALPVSSTPAATSSTQGLIESVMKEFAASLGQVAARLDALEAHSVPSPPVGQPSSSTTPASTPFFEPTAPADAAATLAAARTVMWADQAAAPPEHAGPPGLLRVRSKAAPPTPSAPTPTEPYLVETLQAMTSALQRVGTAKASSGYEPLEGAATTLEELEQLGISHDLGAKMGAAQLERLRLTREARPELVSLAHEKEIQRALKVLPGEAWSYGRHAREHVLPAAAGHHGLRKFVTILAHALDIGRTQGSDHMTAFVHQAYKAAEGAALHPQKQWTYGWPLLGIDDPDGLARPGFSPAEHAALAAYHKDREQLGRYLGMSTSGAPAPAGQPAAGSGAPGAGATTQPRDDNRALRAELEKLKKDLAAARKAGAGDKGKGGKAKGRGAPPEGGPDL